MTSPFDDLDALREEIQADQDPALVEKYGDESWNAALAVLGFPPNTSDASLLSTPNENA